MTVGCFYRQFFALFCLSYQDFAFYLLYYFLSCGHNFISLKGSLCFK